MSAVETRPTTIPSSRKNAETDPLVGIIETDRFCDSCGHNLHTQSVWRDPNLNILLCRCPECGTVMSASDTANSARRWQRRLGPMLVLFNLAVMFLIAAAAIALQVGMCALIATSTDQYLNRFGDLGMLRTAAWISGSVSFLLGVLVSGLVSAAMYHWRWWGRLLLAWIWPLAVAGFLSWVFFMNEPDDAPMVSRVFFTTVGFNLIGGTLAAIAGRALPRVIASIFVPPRMRQRVAHLWLADGKRPPALPAWMRGIAVPPGPTKVR